MVDFCKHPAYSLNHHAGPHREPPSASSSNKARGFHLSPCVRTASLSSGPGRTPGPTPWDGTLARPPSPAGIRATGSPTPEEAPGPRTSSLSCGPRTSHPGPVLCAACRARLHRNPARPGSDPPTRPISHTATRTSAASPYRPAAPIRPTFWVVRRARYLPINSLAASSARRPELMAHEAHEPAAMPAS